MKNTILFCSGKEESFLILNHMVEFFEAMSGLKINKSKCQILGINGDQEKIGRWAEKCARLVLSLLLTLGSLWEVIRGLRRFGIQFFRRFARGLLRGRKAFSPKRVG